MVSVVAVGTAVMDYIFAVDELPQGGGKHFASGYSEIGGGPAANGAVAAARLGARAALWARVGADAVGDRLIAELAGDGVDTTHVRRVAGGRSSLSAVMVDGRGERMIVNYTDADLDADASWLPLDGLAGADAILVHHRWPAGAAAVMERARSLGVPSVIDADVIPEREAEDLVILASHAAFSQGALRELTGTGDIADGLRAAHARTQGWVCVTAGSEGCYWIEDNSVRHQPAFAVEVVDTLGAGDVFHGALAVALGEGRGEADAVRFASAAAALKCTRFGGRAGIPERAEVDRFLAATG
jgi:sulfofructose kinase